MQIIVNVDEESTGNHKATLIKALLVIDSKIEKFQKEIDSLPSSPKWKLILGFYDKRHSIMDYIFMLKSAKAKYTDILESTYNHHQVRYEYYEYMNLIDFEKEYNEEHIPNDKD